MAKDARQFDERLNDDATVVAEPQAAARADDVTPDDAIGKGRRGPKPKPVIEPSDLGHGVTTRIDSAVDSAPMR